MIAYVSADLIDSTDPWTPRGVETLAQDLAGLFGD